MLSCYGGGSRLNYLIVLNRKYPYQSGEAFLESEVGVLASEFNQVIFFPVNPVSTSKPSRKVDQPNIKVVVRKTNLSIKLARISLESTRAFFGVGSWKSRVKRVHMSLLANIQYQIVEEWVNRQSFFPGDNVYIYSYWLFSTAMCAMKVVDLLTTKGVRCVSFSRAHRFDIYNELPFQKSMIHNLDKIFSVSDDGTAFLEDRYPDDSSKIETQRLGTLDHGISKENGTNTFEILSCSRITDIKRVSAIAETISLLDGEAVHWTHIGGGPLMGNLEDLVKRLGIQDKCTLLGKIPNSSVYEYYTQHHVDVFINLSTSEGLPVSIMEAISFGIPVVATDVGGTREIVFDGVNGSLVPLHTSTRDVADLINDYISATDSQKYKLRKNSRKIWEEKYDALKNYKCFCQTIKSI